MFLSSVFHSKNVYTHLHKYTVIAVLSSSIDRYVAINVTRDDCDTDQKTYKCLCSGFVQYLQGQGVISVANLKFLPV